MVKTKRDPGADWKRCKLPVSPKDKIAGKIAVAGCPSRSVPPGNRNDLIWRNANGASVF
jgi:hypothetical protein